MWRAFLGQMVSCGKACVLEYTSLRRPMLLRTLFAHGCFAESFPQGSIDGISLGVADELLLFSVPQLH